MVDIDVSLEGLVSLPGYRQGLESGIALGEHYVSRFDEFIRLIDVKEKGLWNIAAAVYGILDANEVELESYDDLFRKNIKELNEEALNDYNRHREMGIDAVFAFAITHVAASIRNNIQTNPHFKFFELKVNKEEISPIFGMQWLGNLVQAIKNPIFPINFYDIETIKECYNDDRLNRLIPDVFRYVMAQQNIEIDYVAGAEARGLSYAGYLAGAMVKKFIEIRKGGSIPGLNYATKFMPEYPPWKWLNVKLEERKGNAVIIDDLEATAETMIAGANAIECRDGKLVYNIGKDKRIPFIDKWYTSLGLKKLARQLANEATMPESKANVVAFMNVILFTGLGGIEKIKNYKPNALNYGIVQYEH